MNLNAPIFPQALKLNATLTPILPEEPKNPKKAIIAPVGLPPVIVLGLAHLHYEGDSKDLEGAKIVYDSDGWLPKGTIVVADNCLPSFQY